MAAFIVLFFVNLFLFTPLIIYDHKKKKKFVQTFRL